ncbi:hypothetical protein LX36DRAFT_674368 [Colletotrichum falcatum]|nr:hypothetical protein LX36DRAFT_674368 [Colletotrichum falcatum]
MTIMSRLIGPARAIVDSLYSGPPTSRPKSWRDLQMKREGSRPFCCLFMKIPPPPSGNSPASLQLQTDNRVQSLVEIIQPPGKHTVTAIADGECPQHPNDFDCGAFNTAPSRDRGVLCLSKVALDRAKPSDYNETTDKQPVISSPHKLRSFKGCAESLSAALATVEQYKKQVEPRETLAALQDRLTGIEELKSMKLPSDFSDKEVMVFLIYGELVRSLP